MDYKSINDLSTIVNDAIDQTRDSQEFNLLLSYEFDIALINSDFINNQEDKAKMWISKEVDERLYFSHGQYYLGEEGQKFVLNELKTKKTSRRALLSTCQMEGLMYSGDKPFPAFLVLQFSIENNLLYVTAYFRALEVHNFLKINIAEIGLHIRKIKEQIIEIENVRLVILAFNGFCKENAKTGEKAIIDFTDREEIAFTVKDVDIDLICTWLDDKKRCNSYMELKGLDSLFISMEKSNQRSKKLIYSIQIIEKLSELIGNCRAHSNLLTKTNSERALNENKSNIISNIDSLSSMLLEIKS